MTQDNDKNQNSVNKAAALKYNMEEDQAPKIIARGKGELAQKIVEKAQEQEIPIKKDEDIVEVLAQMEIGAEIPEKLYEAVAEILSFIYSMENQNR